MSRFPAGCASWSRTSKRGSGGAVLRRDEALAVLTWKPGPCFHELLFWQTLALRVHATVTEAFGRISSVVCVMVDLGPEDDAPFALENLDIISTCPLYLAVARPGCVSLEAIERISHIFYGKVNSDPGCLLNELFT